MLRPLLCVLLVTGWFAPTAQAADELSLYLIDIETGKLTPVADEPLPGYTNCGSASWSADGKRILFDATPGVEWSKSHIVVTDSPPADKPAFTDLGPGNCPSWSPDAKRIAFLLNPGAMPNAEPGLWLMNADGSGRRRLGDGARVTWSPDGRQILSVTFRSPCQLTLVDADTGDEQGVELADHQFYSVPLWADEETIVAVVRSQAALSIALVDVSQPDKAVVRQVLWTRGSGTGDEPTYPVYSSKRKRCAFIGRSAAGFALYVVDDKTGGVAKLLEPAVELKPEYEFSRIAGLAISPAGDQLLFGGERQRKAE